jgi:hypothetical protein
MTCPKCEKREQQAERCLAECEQRTKTLELKSHRLQLALTCMGTILGQEAFEAALSTSEIVSDLGVVEAPVEPDVVAMAPTPSKPPKPRTDDPRPAMKVDDLFSYVPPLLTVDFYTRRKAPDFVLMGVSSWDESVAVPSPGALWLGTFGLNLLERRKRG